MLSYYFIECTSEELNLPKMFELMVKIINYYEIQIIIETFNVLGKVVIITGANTGIGKETAIDLAKRGGKIYMACRDINRGEAALQEVRELSGSKSVFYMQLDLASMESIRHFSQKYVINHNSVQVCYDVM